jgi:hypothetical protein
MTAQQCHGGADTTSGSRYGAGYYLVFRSFGSLCRCGGTAGPITAATRVLVV